MHGVMVGRGALTKPWIFDEFSQNRAWDPTAAERVAVYRRLACYMKEHFGDDARGRCVCVHLVLDDDVYPFIVS